MFDETSETIWMAWRLGTWMIRKSDIVAREPWETMAGHRPGVAEIVYVRIDAEIHEAALWPGA